MQPELLEKMMKRVTKWFYPAIYKVKGGTKGRGQQPAAQACCKQVYTKERRMGSNECCMETEIVLSNLLHSNEKIPL